MGYLGLFVIDSNSGHKKIKRFEKNIYHTHALSCEKLSIMVKVQEQKEVENSNNYYI